MVSDASEELQRLIAAAVPETPGRLTIELSRDRFAALGSALDETTEILERRAYRLARVRGEEWGWVATYEPIDDAD